MATVTYTFVERCGGGGHAVFDVSLNGGANNRMHFVVDELRAPLAQMSEEERVLAAQQILRVHFAGKTRAQIAAEVQNPVTVTI